jgi:hypothetical protein
MNPFLKKALQRLSPVRPWFRDISRESLRDDAFAGLTNAAIVLPQGVAFAIIAGLPPEYGLFTAIFVCAVAALWGASMVMVSGPTTAISAVVFATLTQFAPPGTEAYIALALTLTLMVGVLQLVAGIAGLGGLIAFVSHSVIVGFTAAAALLIGASQIAGSLGIETEGGGGVFERLLRVVEHIEDLNISALIVSVVTLSTILALVRIDKRIPAYIFALITGSLTAWLLGGTDVGLRLFEPLSAVVPTPTVPDLSPALLDLASGFGFDAIASGYEAMKQWHHSADIAVEATGVPAVAAGLTDYLANGGKGLFFGVCPSEARIEISPFEIFRRQLTLAGSHSLNHNIPRSLDIIRGWMNRSIRSCLIDCHWRSTRRSWPPSPQGQLKVQWVSD